MDLNAQLAENQSQQAAAAAAMQEATAQMIYQQAAAGLDAGASLELANAMGLLSEQDYSVASVVGILKTEFDANSDGMISAAEAARGYTKSIELMNKAVQNLQAAKMPITVDNIAKEMANLEGATAQGNTTETVKAIATAAPDLSAFSEGMDGIAEGSEKAADKTGDANTAIGATPNVAGPAATAIDGLNRALDPTAKLAGDLGTALKGIHNVSVHASANPESFQNAITWIHNLGAALDQLPASKTINVTVSATASGTTTPPPSSGPPTGGPKTAAESPPAGATTLTEAPVYITNNVYNPMAAAILAEQQWQLLQQRISSR
jgi:hypothetical protein